MVAKIAIAGISGQLGRKVAEELLKQPDLEIRGSCRDVSKLEPFLKESSRISLIETGPYDKDLLRTLVEGCDVVICTYFADNEVMTEGQKLLVDLCDEENVPRYIASDYTADYTKLDWGSIPLKDPMKTVKNYLDNKGNVKGVHILVGIMMETFLMVFPPWDQKEKTFQYWGSGEEVWEMTSYKTAAEYVAAVALDPSAVGMLRCKSNHPFTQHQRHAKEAILRNFVIVAGERKTSFEVADDVEAVYGVKLDRQCASSLEDLARHAEPYVQDKDIRL